MAQSKQHVLLGRISTAHGIRGEVVIKSFTENPGDINGYGPLFDEKGERTFVLSALRVVKKGVIARIDGVTDRNAAEALRGTGLYVLREQLPAPDEDELYHEDLIGLVAVQADGDVIGKVIAIQNFGAGDLVEIQLSGKNRTEFVPFNDHFVTDINLDQQRMIVIMP